MMKRIEVVAAVICRDGYFFATQRGYGEFKDYWEFPGGKINPAKLLRTPYIAKYVKNWIQRFV